MEAKIEIHIGKDSVIIEGSESFVKEQADLFYDYCSNPPTLEDEDATSIDSEHLIPKGGHLLPTMCETFMLNFLHQNLRNQLWC